MRYIFKQIWFLIVLLFVACAYVFGQHSSWPGYALFEQYFCFAWTVIIIGIIAGLTGNAIPRRFRWDRHPFAAFPWEREGRFYQDKLKVSLWKDRMFDISKISGGTSSKSIGLNASSTELGAVLQETCVAETTHWVLILISPVFLLTMHRGVLSTLGVVAYILANLADIVIQRFNRPRFSRLYQLTLKREQRSSADTPNAQGAAL